MEISNFNSLLILLNDKLTALKNLIAEYNRAIGTGASTPQQIDLRNNQIRETITKIKNSVTEINGIYFSPQELQLLSKSDFAGIFNDLTLSQLQQVISTPNNPNNQSLLNTTFVRINRFVTTIQNAYNSLKTFSIDTTINEQDDYDYIDIIFQKNTEVDNFIDAREQVSDWYLIIYGYALLLNKSVEEFEIITIEKNSPIRIRVKIDIPSGKAIRIFTTALLVLANTFVEREVLLDNLNKLSHKSELDAQRNAYIDAAKKQAEEELKIKIDELVTKTLNDRQIEGRGDIKNAMKVAAKKQYNFYINGGNVNISLGSGDVEQTIVEDLEKYQLAKDTLQHTLNKADDLKVLPSKASLEDTDGE